MIKLHVCCDCHLVAVMSNWRKSKDEVRSRRRLNTLKQLGSNET